MANGVVTTTPGLGTLRLAEVQAGDVLLSLGHGELSRLLAWNGDSDYSHGALAVGDGDLAEAATTGSRRMAIDDPRRWGEMVYTDVYRPICAAGERREPRDIDAVVAAGLEMLGRPYPIDFLKQLAIIVTVRQHVPHHAIGRLLVRVALDHLANDESQHLTCTELVFRAFDEAQVQPVRALSPVVKVIPFAEKPRPSVDWLALWKEVEPLLAASKTPANGKRGGATPLPATPQSDVSALLASGEIPRDDHPAITDAAIAKALAAARARHLRAVPPPRAPDAKALRRDLRLDIVPNPNPKTVIPVDFQTSPSYRRMGRIAV